MAGASKFAFLLSRRFKLCSRSLFPLSRNSYFTISAPRNEWKDSAMPNDQPRRWCSSVADERFQTQGRSSMPCDETHGSPVLPWSEWHKFVEYLTSRGYAGRVRVPPEGDEEEFSLDTDNMPEDFRKAAVACLRYAIEWPDLLRSLSRKEIEVLVENGSPFIFRKASDSVSRMKLFIYNQGNGVPTYEQARTIDLMRYLLSYVWNFLNSTGESNDGRQKLIESSVKTLLHELVNISSGIYGTDYIKSFGRNAYNEDYGALRRPYQTIEMKKGDWLCPKCNFMNFARNAKCLECNETRPKVQPTNGDWECPQCNFFNYARNMKCLRCDCRRPEGILPSKNPGFDQILNSSNVEKAEIERRLAENDEKAERWFSKISQLDSSSDLSSSIHDEDFPEIMPLRKGMNRFVLSTRKTPLERRMANMASQGTLSESTVSQTLDRILGTGAGKDSSFASVEKKISNAVEQQDYGKQMPRGGAWNSRYDQSKDDARESSYHVENQHVAPPPYKRRIAVEQANNSNFIPFVPLPPDYFAKKENQLSQPSNSGQRESQPCQPLSSGQQDSQQSQHHNLGQHESLQGQPWSLGPRQSQHSQPSSFGQRESLQGQPWSFSQQESQQSQPLSFGQRESQQNQPSRWGQRDCPQSQSPSLVQQASEHSQSPSLDQQESQRASENFNYGFVGKSLEGSAVTEPDPLDMSEEAKAQRWFKRVSQIKDISELSNIPDEDFPEIMPLRKGVNRFVVSKRKTPLERRLTSPQYRRNLPIMTSLNSGKDPTGERD